MQYCPFSGKECSTSSALAVLDYAHRYWYCGLNRFTPPIVHAPPACGDQSEMRERGTKSQALANLQKKTAQGATNTPDGKAEQVETPDSTSMITENGGFVK